MRRRKKKNTGVVWKLVLALVNMVNLVLTLLLALQKQKDIAVAIDAHGLRRNTDNVLVFGGDDGPTAVYVKNAGEEKQA